MIHLNTSNIIQAAFWLKITHNAVLQEERQKISFHGKFNSFHIFLAYYLPMM